MALPGYTPPNAHYALWLYGHHRFGPFSSTRSSAPMNGYHATILSRDAGLATGHRFPAFGQV